MKNKKKLILALSLISIFSMVGTSCSNNQQENSSQVESGVGAYGLPTTIPVLNVDSIQIHYNRTSGDYNNWALWLWQSGGDGASYDFNYEDDFGLVASYPLTTFGNNVVGEGLGFIVKKGEWEEKDVTSDRFVDFSTLTKDANGVYHVYLYQGDENVYIDANKSVVYKVKDSRFTDEKTIFVQGNSQMTGYKLYKDGVQIQEGTINSSIYGTIKLNDAVDFGANYSVGITFAGGETEVKADVSKTKLFSTTAFQEAYNYDGQLGAIYTESETTFRVWSPIAKKIELKLYTNGTPVSVSSSVGSDEVYKTIEMTSGSKGTFEASVSENLDGYYYTYKVYTNAYPDGKEIVDPYAKACGVNGLRGMIVDFSTTNPEGWDEITPHQYDRKSLAVYETHVVDVTSSSTWNGPANLAKTYKGMVTKGTTLASDSSIKTGYDHILDLGVNAIQLQPIFDHANDEVNKSFNWGYNPLNYNCLEGSYSSDPYNGKTRIKEFKELIKQTNEDGINIIMDVVYNHVNDANTSNFNILMPGYYFRYSGSSLSNGSGCGNETASENYMMRKFMIDSATFWASEYKLGGFRFDLMGLHDITTMNSLTAACKEINPSICIYGEPWTGGTTSYTGLTGAQAYGNKYEGYGQFNDQMRDALIKGGLSGVQERGWITSSEAPNSTDVSKIMAGLKGITMSSSVTISDPNKTVNYVTCHDNYTLSDRIEAAGITDEDTIAKMSVLANAVVFTSQGTSFMLSGEEMLRTKNGDSNSYNASYEENALDYSKLATTLGSKVYNNYKSLVEFKKSTGALHYEEEDIKSYASTRGLDDDSVIKYTIQDAGKEYVIIHTNGYETTHSSIDLTGYTLYLDTLGELNGTTLGSVVPKAYQTIIAYK